SAGTGTPTARENHTAIWTGSTMIVWGGLVDESNGTTVNTGGIYTPSSDSWLATSTTNAPAARHNHSAIWTGVQMVVWGGEETTFGTFSHTLNSGGAYDPSTDSWVAVSSVNAPARRTYH